MLGVITGPVKSGKSKMLMDWAAKFEGIVLAFVPKTEDSTDAITPYGSNISMPCTQIKTPLEILSRIPSAAECELMVIIDNYHKMKMDVIDVIGELNYTNHCQIMVAGLSRSWRNEPSEMMCRTMGMADQLARLKTTCYMCKGENAYNNIKINDAGESRLEPACNGCYVLVMRESNLPFVGDRPVLRQAMNAKALATRKEKNEEVQLD